MVRLVWSRIVRLPAEGSFRRLLKLLYPASSRPVKRRSAANLGIWRNSGATIGSDTGLGFLLYRIGSVPLRFFSRPPSAIAITTRISSGRGASAIETVIVEK